MKRGLVLFAHGARDPRWAEPFAELLKRVRQRSPSLEVRLAFLELMEPDLATAVGELIEVGARTVKIVPVFFGQGGHIRDDLPVLVAKLQRDHPDAAISAVAPAGEASSVIEALAAYCLEDI